MILALHGFFLFLQERRCAGINIHAWPHVTTSIDWGCSLLVDCGHVWPVCVWVGVRSVRFARSYVFGLEIFRLSRNAIQITFGLFGLSVFGLRSFRFGLRSWPYRPNRDTRGRKIKEAEHGTKYSNQFCLVFLCKKRSWSCCMCYVHASI